MASNLVDAMGSLSKNQFIFFLLKAAFALLSLGLLSSANLVGDGLEESGLSFNNNSSLDSIPFVIERKSHNLSLRAPPPPYNPPNVPGEISQVQE